MPVTVAERVYAALAPYAFGLVWLTARGLGTSQDELDNRTGRLPGAGTRLVWFHGASAGEMAAATQLAALLRDNGCTFTAGFTATNRAGVDFVSRTLGGTAAAGLAPWDVPRWLARAFDQWQPLAILLVETEIWPGLILEAYRRKVPVFSVSARIYPRDVPRYAAIRPLMAPTLRRLTGILVQNEAERARFVNLGAPLDRCVAVGNLKYVGAEGTVGDAAAFRQELGVGRDEQLVVCGSMHADEIGFLFRALEQLPVHTLRVIVAPRHVTAAAAVVKASVRRRWTVRRRTAASHAGDWRVLLLDTMGELSRAYALASVAVVGGGFRRHGGHNPLEPVIAGAPVILGPHCDHFAQEATDLTAATPEACVSSPPELAQRLAEWLRDDVHRRRVLARQRRVVPDGKRIARGYLTALLPWFERSGA